MESTNKILAQNADINGMTESAVQVVKNTMKRKIKNQIELGKRKGDEGCDKNVDNVINIKKREQDRTRMEKIQKQKCQENEKKCKMGKWMKKEIMSKH